MSFIQFDCYKLLSVLCKILLPINLSNGYTMVKIYMALGLVVNTQHGNLTAWVSI